jgi:aspartate aminotransferase-like enzyme
MPLHDFQKYRLMAPGPVPLSQKVIEALRLPMIHHRTPEYEKIFQEALSGLKWMFQTRQPVMILSSTGTGGMEAALVNCLSPGDKVLVVVSGKFGERWKKIADIYGFETEVFESDWGARLDLEAFESALSKPGYKYKAVLTQVCETSTATLHPIRQMAALCRRHQAEALFMVDAISAIGCTPLPMDAWDLDVMVAGSQKAFALPTGLSFVALSERAWEANAEATSPRFYFDLKLERQSNEKGESHFSSSVILIRALNAVLHEFKAIGLENLAEDIGRRAEATRRGANELGLDIYSQCPSPSVTAVKVPSGVNGAKLRDHIEEKYNLTLMGGQDHLKGKILRFGHMGAISPEDILASLEALALALRDLGYADIKDPNIVTALETARRILA